MDDVKKASFVKAMGKKKRLGFSKGGMVKRKKYADGDLVTAQGNPDLLLGGPGGATVNSASNPNTGYFGTIGNALGLNNQFQAGSANIQAGTNAAQLNQSYLQNQQALAQAQALQQALAQQNALQNQNQVYNQLQGIVQGTGPNPALAMLNQQTGQNVANQAALMAGQRGASANAGLIARQAAQQGAATQQQAVGQGATLEAQQQMNAINAAGNLANNQAGNLLAGTGQNINAQQNEQNILQGANTAFNNAGVGMQSNINTANAQTAAGNQSTVGKIFGGLASGVSSALGLGLADGGEVYARGGNVCEGPHNCHVANYLMSKGGQVPAMVSPGEIYLSPENVEKVVTEGQNPMKIGQKIGGKAKVKGDSKKNDTVEMTLEEGGVVIPRHVVNKMSREKAELFVHKAIAKKRARS